MKKLLKLKNVLIAIAFTVFLLLVKDNMGVVGDILNKIITILTGLSILTRETYRISPITISIY